MSEKHVSPFVHNELLGVPVEPISQYFPSADELSRLRQRATEDPSGILRIRAVRQGMDYWETVLIAAVRLAREQGNSWTEIAEALGITRQAAWKRFAGLPVEEDESPVN